MLRDGWRWRRLRPRGRLDGLARFFASWQQFAEALTDLGADVHIANPQAVGLIAKNRLKNDKVDSKILAELLHSGFLPESYIAPKAVRDLREHHLRDLYRSLVT